MKVHDRKDADTPLVVSVEYAIWESADKESSYLSIQNRPGFRMGTDQLDC
jgi:hypothetical protein